MPLPVKYSAFATNVTFRLTISGMKIESENERWLLAMIAGPRAGTLSRPSTLRPEDHSQPGAEEDVLEQPVQHACPFCGFGLRTHACPP